MQVVTYTQYATGSDGSSSEVGVETVVVPVYPASSTTEGESAEVAVVTVFVDPGSGAETTGLITTDVVNTQSTTNAEGIVVVETLTSPVVLTKVARQTDGSLQTPSSDAPRRAENMWLAMGTVGLAVVGSLVATLL